MFAVWGGVFGLGIFGGGRVDTVILPGLELIHVSHIGLNFVAPLLPQPSYSA